MRAHLGRFRGAQVDGERGVAFPRGVPHELHHVNDQLLVVPRVGGGKWIKPPGSVFTPNTKSETRIVSLNGVWKIPPESYPILPR